MPTSRCNRFWRGFCGLCSWHNSSSPPTALSDAKFVIKVKYWRGKFNAFVRWALPPCWVIGSSPCQSIRSSALHESDRIRRVRTSLHAKLGYLLLLLFFWVSVRVVVLRIFELAECMLFIKTNIEFFLNPSTTAVWKPFFFSLWWQLTCPKVFLDSICVH